MPDPHAIDKYLYVERTPTWKVRALYAFGIVSWLLVLWGFGGAVRYDPFYRYFVGPILIVLTVYQLSSFILNLFYRQFDLAGHLLWVKIFWIMRGRQSPVDVFLPICGEDVSILRNTWEHVARLNYKNKRVYVLDDSTEDCAAHEALAVQFGFQYFARPNKGAMKKAGNLKYAFERTKGEFIVILDGDFAPHPDFLTETLPYMSDKKVGIVQTPQFFEMVKKSRKGYSIAYGSARVQEIFYRIIQVSRDRLGGAHCCGTCALYRRTALSSIDGFVQMEHSEDAHTGFALASRGWTVRYLPITLAIGLCPDNVYALFHQQHRWCLGNVVLVLSKKFWTAPISWTTKFCYLTGFIYNIHYPLIILYSFQLFWTLFIYNDVISLNGAMIFYPYVAFTIFCLILPLSRLRLGCLSDYFIKTYSNAHALFSIVSKTSVGWIPTGAKHVDVSPAFKQTMCAVGLYVAVYGSLLLFAAFLGYLHPFDLNYYSVQFWLFYNMALSMFLFWQMYAYYRKRKRVSAG
ncbi:hypothetical protein A3J43_01265 [Candidatus Uhrbacteria bacterium RIFCSPHIGHO2_12_FULL_54_23]|uniref:Glycosyltransferase 2-like domain-containing protein n=2 Tax=Candidatus Uhriibacteriota TaxID=1752732 RepID=A0A1F7UMQ3_9BACT|nr:MAG: hypothetical protein A3J43_01265 [Candidatus Uhrbacteria bacterium RIFCSPHIGHO2_12_FULL_54_23]OGL91166.1 MAG: hypothetical protein A3J36_01760 [Candidatus Uhrbacteria bacterium RIFCSPLOWO2_02_FULL_54_37]